MQNEHREERSNQVKRNPTRFNKTIKQGPAYEERMGGESPSNRNAEFDKSKHDQDEVSRGRSDVPNSSNSELHDKANREIRKTPSVKDEGNQQTQSQDVQSSGSGKNESSGYDPNRQFDENEDLGMYE